MKEYPRHSSGYNLPVDLGYDSEDWSPEEFLCVRPFRSSWDSTQWGDLDGYYEFKPVKRIVAEGEVTSLLERCSTRIEFDALIEKQRNKYKQDLANELMSAAILLFGYENRGLSFEEVAATHFSLTEEQVSLLRDIKEWWVKHPELNGSLEFMLHGGWGHLSHSWSVGVHLGTNPYIALDPSEGQWIAHQRRP